MKYFSAILVLIACSTYALPSFADIDTVRLAGNYNCVAVDDTEQKSQLKLDASGSILVTRGDQIFQGTLSNRTNFLSMIEKEVGIAQFLIIAENSDDAPLLRMLKLKDGRLLIEELDDSKLVDRSEDTSFELKFQSDVACTPLE